MTEKIRTDFLGIEMPNPFMLASAPPSRNREMIDRAFRAGWGGAVIKTLTQYTGTEGCEVRNVSPRIHTVRGPGGIAGFTNIELTSQQTNEESCDDIQKLKKSWPDRAVIASILYGHSPIKECWQRAAADCEAAGADALELNFSCPHGCSELGSGISIGENPAQIKELIGWVKAASKLPVIVKLPSMSDIVLGASVSKREGADAICAINTISSMPYIDIESAHPVFNVGGVGVAGGMSGRIIRPIALRSVMEIARSVSIPISASGGVYGWRDAVEFILVGASTLQICSAVMEHGYGIINDLCCGLSGYMARKNYKSVADFCGKALEHVAPHSALDRDNRFVPKWDSYNCLRCGKCVISCRDGGYQAITMQDRNILIDTQKCDGCGLCRGICPEHCIN